MKFLSKSQQEFFVNIDKIILKFIQKGKGTRIAKTNLKKKIKWEGSVYLISRQIPTVIKTV